MRQCLSRTVSIISVCGKYRCCIFCLSGDIHWYADRGSFSSKCLKGVKSDWYNLTEARSTGLWRPSVDVQNKDLFLCHYQTHLFPIIHPTASVPSHISLFMCFPALRITLVRFSPRFFPHVILQHIDPPSPPSAMILHLLFLLYLVYHISTFPSSRPLVSP